MPGGTPVTELPPHVNPLPRITHPPVLPPLPVTESDLVLIGKVEALQPYLSSPSKSQVYTEFEIHLESVFKILPDFPVAVGSKVIADRLGGVVRLPSGRVITARVEKRNLPLKDQRYVFFLKSNAGLGSFTIVSAYEIVDDAVFPLDEAHDPHQVQSYSGAALESLLADLRNAIKP
jgi:hypothetical protein